MLYQYHHENIIKTLAEDSIFVFGSNLAGLHQEGAAKIALDHFGALAQVGRGWAGQSFAIPTMNEHLQQMPLSQIQHYVDDFKTYSQNHPQKTYFITAIGCGAAGYKVEEIAPMFKGISSNVILPISFLPFVENPLAKLTQKFLQTFFRPDIILAQSSHTLIDVLALSADEKNLAQILLSSEIYPTDSNGRDRVFEIKDIIYHLNDKIFDLDPELEDSLIFAGSILALLELYNLNEQDFIDVWQGRREIAPPQPANFSHA